MIPIRRLTPSSSNPDPAGGGPQPPVPPSAPAPPPAKKLEPVRMEAKKSNDRFQAFCDLKTSLHKNLIDQVDLDVLVKLDHEIAQRQIETILSELISQQNKMPLTQSERAKVIQEVVHETFGLGPLEPLLEDPQVDEILVNRCDTVYVERGGKLFRTGVRFKDDTHLRHVISRIASRVGRRIDESSPMVDARLADGSRVNAVIPPLALDGCCLSIRKFRENPLTLEELMELGTFSAELVELLRVAVAAKCNILISGGTGSGKTTLLNVLSQFLSHEERIITIEDAAEIRLRQPHVVRLETRPPNVEGKGIVGARDLVRNALRMRPDSIIVGEVRGPEAMDMLQAMNTGHDGSMTTVHANTPRDALTRIETMVLLAAGNLDQRSINRQIASAIDLVVQIRRYPDGRRRVDSVAEVTGMEGATICIQELASFDGEASKEGSVTGSFKIHRTTPKLFTKAVELGVELPSWMKRIAERPQARGGGPDPGGGLGL
jgi:pilus assembly protein CpaF